MSCADEHCITCGDVGVPMRVMTADAEGQATCVDDTGSRHEIAVELVEPVQTGQALLVHAGVAIGRLP